MRKVHFLTLPGLGGSGPNHWQSIWEQELEGCRRAQLGEWDSPTVQGWMAVLDREIRSAKHPVVLLAHSLACALVTNWADRNRDQAHKILAAFLVGPADVDSPRHTPEITRPFGPMPLAPLPFPAHVVASSNDPYVDPVRARLFADSWGAGFSNIGDHGHINADSGHGRWPDGLMILDGLLAQIRVEA